MGINDIFTKSDSMRLELCSKCPRMPYEEANKLKRTAEQLEQYLKLVKDQLNLCNASNKVKKNTITQMMAALKTEKALAVHKQREIDFIKERVNKLFGGNAWSMIFATVEAPTNFVKKEYKTVVRKRIAKGE